MENIITKVDVNGVLYSVADETARGQIADIGDPIDVNVKALSSGGTELEFTDTVNGARTPIDQNYNPESSNPQSGKAVAEAIANVSGGGTDLSNYYTKAQIDNMEFITVADIDAICNMTIEVADEGVVF